MSVSESEKSLRRRLLFNSLPAGTSLEIIQQAIDLLDNEFGEEPNLLYGSLVNRLKETLDERRVNLGGLLGKIMVLRNKPVADIGPEPPFSGNSRTAQPAAATQPVGVAGDLTVQDKVFNSLLLGIATAVKQRNADNLQEMTEFLKSEALTMGLATPTSKSLAKWIAMPMDGPKITGNVENLHRIINTCFVWMCKKFGPVDADKILLFGVKTAETLPESFEHSPRKFL